LIIYDDLTKQAWAYRQISLLLRRPPGREAYPGDVFYLHSRLLERAARVNADYVEQITNGAIKGKTGSLTALPIIETQAGDVSAFVPTKIIKKLSGGIRTALAQYRELAAFSQFASDLDEATKAQLDHGERVTELMKQKQYAPQSIAEMALLIYAADNDFLNDVTVEKIGDFEDALLSYSHSEHGVLLEKVAADGGWDKDTEASFKSLLESFKSTQTW
jgi:F-type H+-transporting ATPase subunit alpha